MDPFGVSSASTIKSSKSSRSLKSIATISSYEINPEDPPNFEQWKRIFFWISHTVAMVICIERCIQYWSPIPTFWISMLGYVIAMTFFVVFLRKRLSVCPPDVYIYIHVITTWLIASWQSMCLGFGIAFTFLLRLFIENTEALVNFSFFYFLSVC